MKKTIVLALAFLALQSNAQDVLYEEGFYNNIYYRIGDSINSENFKELNETNFIKPDKNEVESIERKKNKTKIENNWLKSKAHRLYNKKLKYINGSGMEIKVDSITLIFENNKLYAMILQGNYYSPYGIDSELNNIYNDQYILQEDGSKFYYKLGDKNQKGNYKKYFKGVVSIYREGELSEWIVTIMRGKN